MEPAFRRPRSSTMDSDMSRPIRGRLTPTKESKVGQLHVTVGDWWDHSSLEDVRHAREESAKQTVYLKLGRKLLPHGTVKEKELSPPQVEGGLRRHVVEVHRSEDSTDHSGNGLRFKGSHHLHRSEEELHRLNCEHRNGLQAQFHHPLNKSVSSESVWLHDQRQRRLDLHLPDTEHPHHSHLIDHLYQHSVYDPHTDPHNGQLHHAHGEGKRHTLLSFIMRHVKHGQADDTVQAGGQSKMKKSHSMSLPNFFTRRSEGSNKVPVFTVDVASDDQPVLSASLDVASDSRYGLNNPAFRHLGVHQIQLRRRSGNSWSEDDIGYHTPYPLLQLSPRSLRVSDDETASMTSSNASQASNDESESSDESSDSERVMSRLTRHKILSLDFDDGILDVTSNMTSSKSNVELDEKSSRGREPSRQLRLNPVGTKERNHTRCLSASKELTLGMENDLQGPRVPLFTASIFNRIGRKNGLGESLMNVSHVSHVFKGTVLVTDILDGKISFVARSGRAVKEFVTETGSEPWCACITPRGHVAVTLRRHSCVTVWCGNGTLVREFGHGVLECPTGLACDRQGRFIVSDERTNQVAFFSPTGEFLGFLGQLHNNNDDDSHDNSGSNNNSILNSNSGSGSGAGNQANSKGRTNNNDSSLHNEDKRSTADKNGKQGLAASFRPYTKHVSNGKPAGSKAKDDVPLACQRKTDQPSPYEAKVGLSFAGSPNRKVSWIDEMDEEDLDSSEDIVTTNARPADTTTAAATTAAKPGSNKNARQADNDKNYTFSMPRYVCVTASDKILVSDSGNHCVKVFSPDGHFLNKVGSYGTGDGNLKVPYGICCDHDENIYIADHYNDRVSVFSLQGEFLQHVLMSASGLCRPKSLAIRPAHVRKLYVAHGGLRSNEVLVYSLVPRGRRSVSFTCDV